MRIAGRQAAVTRFAVIQQSEASNRELLLIVLDAAYLKREHLDDKIIESSCSKGVGCVA